MELYSRKWGHLKPSFLLHIFPLFKRHLYSIFCFRLFFLWNHLERMHFDSIYWEPANTTWDKIFFCEVHGLIRFFTPKVGCDTKTIFQRSTVVLNSVFLLMKFAVAKYKSLVYPTIILSWEENRWIHVFLKCILRSEAKTTSSTIWTWVTESTFYEDNHYAPQILKTP